jgi:hypothetical protein
VAHAPPPAVMASSYPSLPRGACPPHLP